jgi:putative phage-type endonuclease
VPITEHQRRSRRNHLGSSDAPAVLGLSPWQKPADVYWSKVLDSQGDRAPTEAMTVGNRLEPTCLAYAAEELGAELVCNVFRVSRGPDRGVLAANLDAMMKGRAEAVEAKYASQENLADWGEPWTDEVPDHVYIQCLHQMYVAELARVWVAAAVADRRLEYRMYRIERREDLIEAIVTKELVFWHEHVEARVPPTDDPPPLDALRALRREPKSLVALPAPVEVLCDQYQRAVLDRKQAEHAEEKAKARVLAALGEAERGRLPDGRMILFEAESGGRRLDLRRLRAEQPAIWEKYATKTTHRALEITLAPNH